MKEWVIDYATMRDPWWRYKRYLRLWLMTMVATAVIGYLGDGWGGAFMGCVYASLMQAIAFPLWELSERRKDEEWKQGRWP